MINPVALGHNKINMAETPCDRKKLSLEERLPYSKRVISNNKVKERAFGLHQRSKIPKLR